MRRDARASPDRTSLKPRRPRQKRGRRAELPPLRFHRRMATDRGSRTPEVSKDTPMAAEALLVGVFARPDHPEGWGFPMCCAECGAAKRAGRAHGYVVLFVRCAGQDQLDAVATKLAREDFTGGERSSRQYSQGALGAWFGGRFDLVATVPDVDVLGGPFACRGDNRMVAAYDADDVLQ